MVRDGAQDARRLTMSVMNIAQSTNLILRSIAKRCVSKDGRKDIHFPWNTGLRFSTNALDASL